MIPKRLATLTIVAVLTGSYVFLSTASIVAGFETSLFTGNRPYVKLYETPYERQGAAWVCEHAPGTPTVTLSLSVSGFSSHQISRCLAPQGGTINELRVSRNGTIEFERVPPGSLVVFSHYDLDPGFQSDVTGVGKPGQGVFQRLDPSALPQLGEVDKVYDNGPIEVLWIP